MLSQVITDLRERRLWPVVVALALAIIAVPIVLAKSPPSVPPSPVPVADPATALAASLPSVSAHLTPSPSYLMSPPHDPFTPPQQPKSALLNSHVASVASVAGGASSVSAGPASPSALASSGGSATSGIRAAVVSAGLPGRLSATPPFLPAVQIPVGHAKPAPTGLDPKQTYDVTLASTVSGGGLTTIDPLGRLSPVPSASQPWLVELGVLNGGRQVLFAVLPGTTASGPGTCIPGPIDCEVLALGVNQIETVSEGGGPTTEFGVTAVTAHDHGTVATAWRARVSTSALGGSLLAGAGLTAPSLFSYDPRLGALVDLRNLSVGGN